PLQLRIEALTNMQVDATWQRDVRVYHSNLLGREHATLAEIYLTRLKQVTMRFFGLRSAAALVQVVGLGLALGGAFALLSQGQLSLASLAVLFPGIPILSGMISSFIYQMRSMLESLRYADALFDFLTTKFDANDVANNAAHSTAHAHQTLKEIRLEGVSYTYPENQKTALTDISCEFKPGLTAIVGTNGAAKSTLVKLVAGLFPPTPSTIEAMGIELQNVSLSAYVKSVLFQDPGHFPFSIRHNVTMQFDTAVGDDAHIIDALRLAGLWDAIKDFPKGIDTVVGAGFGGVTDLSGGQWQRLALARLLYHNSP